MPGAAALADALVTLTGPSPFAGCSIKGETGRNYLNTAVEPWVDVNPADPRRMVAGWQQDRWSNGGSRSLLSAYSSDGGQSWQRVVVPGINKCSGGTGEFAYDRSSDPWVAIAPDGTSYFMSLSIKNPQRSRPGADAMLVSRSTDGGASWGRPVVLERNTDPHYFNDKNAITADPHDPRYVYATWDRLYDTQGAEADSVDPSAAPSSRPDSVVAARRNLQALRAARSSAKRPAASADYFTGPTLLARTIDGGNTWEAAKTIYDPGQNAQTIGNQAVVLDDGSVLVFYSEIFANGDTKIRFVKSIDHGASFGSPVDAAATQTTSSGTVTPDRRAVVRDGSLLFDVALDRGTGRLYLVWQDGRQDNVDRVAFSMSSDNGASWSAPVIISKTPANPNAYRTQSFVPSVEVGDDAKVYVTYYDFRYDLPKNSRVELSDYWSISCDPGLADCRSPNAWGHETRLTALSFNILNAPYAGGYFLGDYQGLVRQGSGVRAVFGVSIIPRRSSMKSILIH